MKSITFDQYEILRLSNPGARIEVRDGAEVVVIPTWDFDTDQSGEILRKLIRQSEPRFSPGDELKHTKTGSPFNIVDPFKRMLKVRKGPKAE